MKNMIKRAVIPLCFAFILPLLFLAGCISNDRLMESGESGYAEGYKDGLDNGYDAGYGEGYSDGHSDGYNDGYGDGYDKGYADAAGAPPPSTYIIITPDPTFYNYVLNKNTLKFHYPNCTSVEDMAEHNKIYFSGTRDEAIAQGYKPCGRCKP